MATKTKTDIELFQSWKEISVSKIYEKVTKLKQKVKPRGAKLVLNDPDVETFLEKLHRRFLFVTIDKASNKFAFICKQFYITKLMSEVGLNDDTPSRIYFQVSITKEKIINAKITYCKKLDIHVNDKDKTLPITYWLPKMHKTPIGSRFIIAFKTCSTKQLYHTFSKVFKVIYNHVEYIYGESRFYSSFKKFWVVQN